MIAQADWFIHSALLWTFPPTTALVIAPAAPAHPTGGGGTFCVRLGMYVSPRVKILGGVGDACRPQNLLTFLPISDPFNGAPTQKVNS